MTSWGLHLKVAPIVTLIYSCGRQRDKGPRVQGLVMEITGVSHEPTGTLTWLKQRNTLCVAARRALVFSDGGFTMTSPQNVTEMLNDWRNGDQEALDRLIPVVYDELRRQAAAYLRRERPGHTLESAALIHEAYLRLINQQNIEWKNRAHFYAIAARLMRQILVDHARKRQAAKRGGSDIKVPLEEAMAVSPGRNVDLVALDEALTRLAEIDPQQCSIVELRYFSQLSVDETAEVLGVSSRTVKRDWNVAKAWLKQQIGEYEDCSED